MTAGLTIEELITMGYFDNPRFNYRKQYHRLKQIHDFSFNLREKLTPQRKAAIRRVYSKNYRLLGRIERGRYTFLKATKAQIKNLSKQFPVTNKGIIYNRPVDLGTIRTTKIVGRGKQTQLVDTVKLQRRDVKKIVFYVPFPDNFEMNLIDVYMEYIKDRLDPDYLSVAINHYQGTEEYQPLDLVKYAPQLKGMLDIESDGKAKFTGIYIVYFKKRVTKTWLKKVEKIINSLFSI